MTWRLGQGGKGPETQKRHGGILEELPRARIGQHLPHGVTVVMRACGCRVHRLYECPGCGRSCRHLFEMGGDWRCRVCGRLRYRSKREWDHNKLAAANRLRLALGGKPGAMSPLPSRPKTPRAARRYDRLVVRVRALELGGLHDTARVIKSAERLLEDHTRDRSRSDA